MTYSSRIFDNSQRYPAPTDLVKLLGIVRKSGYRGYLPIETLSMKRPGYDSRTAVRGMLHSLEKAIAATTPDPH